MSFFCFVHGVDSLLSTIVDILCGILGKSITSKTKNVEHDLHRTFTSLSFDSRKDLTSKHHMSPSRVIYELQIHISLISNALGNNSMESLDLFFQKYYDNFRIFQVLLEYSLNLIFDGCKGGVNTSKTVFCEIKLTKDKCSVRQCQIQKHIYSLV